MEMNGGFLVTKIKQLGDRIFEKILSEKNIDAFNGAQGRILYVLWQEDGISIRSLSIKCGLAITSLTTMGVHQQPGAQAVSFRHAVRCAGGGQFQFRRGGNAHVRCADRQHRQPPGRAHHLPERAVLCCRCPRNRGRPVPCPDPGIFRRGPRRTKPL